ncbi:hypothetical protein GCM10023189_21810 [Nibrella saemangeumensis]|uniref:Carbon monoxide dehydrogenase subunit G n=1 Tax=Nibrella saemangeumensis TaxID=1084526 RepID=A0ABP8MTY4_9BACT
MQLTGKQVLNAPPTKVWDMLMDTDTLAKVIPGITSLERVGDNAFVSKLQIKLGPVNGSFSGNLQLEDITEHKNFTLKVQQNSKIGNTNAAVKVDLTPVDDNQTEVTFDGDAKLTGILAGMGQRVIGGVANTLTKQFFTNLERELDNSGS